MERIVSDRRGSGLHQTGKESMIHHDRLADREWILGIAILYHLVSAQSGFVIHKLFVIQTLRLLHVRFAIVNCATRKTARQFTHEPLHGLILRLSRGVFSIL